MATLYLLLLVASCLSIHAFPPEPLSYRLKNTIFADEKLEGGIFEHVDEFNDITLYSRSANNPYRLPTTTRPINYNLLWTVEFPRSVFAGDVKIQLHATTENVNEIVLHSQDLNIRSLTLLENDVEVPIENYVLQPEYHFLRVRVLNGVLKYDPTNSVIYTLHITFDAELRTDMTGLYVSWFRNNPNDPESFMASTHMQATAARFAFPCYDEPGFKATFEVTIRRPTALKSWFCTKQVSTGPSTLTGYQEDVYAITPIMPTYLLAVIVADYESVAKYADDGSVLYEVVGREHAISTNQSYYAFDVGQKLLQEMSDYTDYDFYSIHPSLKMTQGSIPDFRAGAMENWGLLLYREAYLMYDEQDTNSHFKATIATILSHEIAHMWFGNLVTCDWWDAFWLNEGFARYFQYFLTDWVEDYMGLTPRFIIEQVHAALLTDSANNPHPLTNPGIGDPVAIRAMFSTISYNKGAAVIRMTDHLLGFNAHRQGLRQYLIDRRFSTATPEHLFQSLQNAAEATGAISEYGADFSVIDYYRSWSVQAGHPVLNVEVDHQSGLMTVYQRRFNINTGYSTATTNWIVPVTFATASNPDFDNTKPTHIISEAVSIINRTTVGDEWVIFNKQQTGYYRVNYDDYTWDLIVMALRGPQRTTIHESNRAQIINDVFQFARSGLMTYTRAFNIISFLENETDYTPWLAAITGFNWIRNRLIQTEYAADLDARIAEWTKTVMTSVGYIPQENEPFTTSYLRYQMAPFACNLKVDECLDSAWTQFRELIDEGKPVPVDNRNWVYCNGLRRGSVADFNVLWNRYLTYNLDTEKILLLQTLGCTPHESALNTFLDAIIQPNYIVRPQDYTTAFNSAVSGNEGNTQIVFRYIQNHLEDVMNAFIIPNQSTPATPLSYISSRLRTAEEVAQFQLWADNNRDTLGSFYQTVRAGASTASIAWAATVQADIQNYLQSGNQVLQTSTPAPVVSISPTTVPVPVLVQPTTPSLPELPGSAHAAFLSTLVVALALAANFAV